MKMDNLIKHAFVKSIQSKSFTQMLTYDSEKSFTSLYILRNSDFKN